MQGSEDGAATTQRPPALAICAAPDAPQPPSDANGVAEPPTEPEAVPEAEAEPTVAPVSPPAVEEDFLNLLDDGAHSGRGLL